MDWKRVIESVPAPGLSMYYYDDKLHAFAKTLYELGVDGAEVRYDLNDTVALLHDDNGVILVEVKIDSQGCLDAIVHKDAPHSNDLPRLLFVALSSALKSVAYV